jgi:hypothetical protein
VPQNKLSPGVITPSPVAADFSVQRANSALVLVRKIVADIVARYDELMELRRERDQLLDNPGNQERLQTLGDRLASRVEDLNYLNRELLAVGCVLKDWRTGLVDFPTLRRGRRVWLCWRLGEPAVAHWHDLHEGFASRQPLDNQFET